MEIVKNALMGFENHNLEIPTSLENTCQTGNIKFKDKFTLLVLFVLEDTDLARTTTLLLIKIPGHDGCFGGRADVLKRAEYITRVTI